MVEAGDFVVVVLGVVVVGDVVVVLVVVVVEEVVLFNCSKRSLQVGFSVVVGTMFHHFLEVRRLDGCGGKIMIIIMYKKGKKRQAIERFPLRKTTKIDKFANIEIH